MTITIPDIPNEIMTMDEVLSMLSISRATLNRRRKNGEIPFYTFGKRVYFKRSEIMAALEPGTKSAASHA